MQGLVYSARKRGEALSCYPQVIVDNLLELYSNISK